MGGRMFMFDIPGDPVYFYIVIDQNHNLTCILFRHHKPTFNPQLYETNGEPPYPVIEINRKGLAYFLNEDQGYKYQCTVTM